MKNRKMLLIIILVVFALIFIDFLKYSSLKVDNQGSVVTTLDSKVKETNKKYDINEIITFEWDYIYVFEPYTSKDEIVNVIGINYYTKTYLLHRFFKGDSGLHDDNHKKIIFVKSGRVVHEENYDFRKMDFNKNLYDKSKVSFITLKDSTYFME